MWFRVLLLVSLALAHDHHGHDHHGHEHGNMGERASFKYSKKANAKENVGPDFPPSHEGHGHSHEGHGHSHEGHGHSHEGHDHSHEGHGHSHEDRGHSLEGHGHSHEGHGHSHEDRGHSPEGHGHSHEGHGHSHEDNKYKPKATLKKQPVFWLEPLLATALISAAPFLILFVVPLESNSAESKPFLKVLLAFASGGLLGDALLHLIPHAISPHSHGGDSDHGHSHHESAHDHSADMLVGLWVLTGLITFLVVEKLVRHIKGGHGHSHDLVHEKTQDKDKPNEKEKTKEKKNKKESEDLKKPCKSGKKESNIKVAAYLNLAADCTHNFTDGLAIGVSFLVSRNVGLITTLTIFLHEIPHEIGDFAILIQSGCTKREAMSLQLVTAVGAFAGCICGLLAESLGAAASSWILPFTAGGFIYIATVSVIPELLEETNLKQSVKEILALLVGVLLMVFIATME